MRSEFDGSAGFFETTEGSSRNMTALYGLSDFWHMMFEDSDKINLLMEANAITASDTYSKFLQLVSSITLEDIQLSLGTQMKLVILAQSSKVQGEVATYKLPDGLQGARYLANRPFLPTVTYEKGADYHIDIDTNTIRFSKDPFQDRFPMRKGSTGEELAIWFIDIETDEKLMYQYYGKLIGVDPAESTEKYKDLLYGLFFLYAHGPDLAMVRRGLNVALGVPLARDDETVLSIRKYPGTDQYFVITDYNSYLLPFGLVPTVQEGDTLKVGEEITTWVEVKDYVNDGDWWINLQLPNSILPYVPEGQPDSYAKPGTYADYLMRNYLKHHTFLVKVNVTTFKNIESFQELGDIIRRVKPTYTTPIYIWSVPIPDEEIRFVEESTSTRYDSSRCEPFIAQIKRMRRNSNDPHCRCCPLFMRMNLGHNEVELLGLDEYANGISYPLAGGTTTGYINGISQFRENTEYEIGLLRAKFRRNERNAPHARSMASFARNLNIPEHTGEYYDPWRSFVPAGMFSVPLYVTTLADLTLRFNSIGVYVPEGGPAFTLMQPYFSDGAINDVGINETLVITQFEAMVAKYSTIFNKGPEGNYIGNFMPDSAKISYKPPVSHLKETDFLLCTQIYEKTYAVYWITSSLAATAKTYRSVRKYADSDTLKVVNSDMPMTRGLGPSMRAPAYMTRGGLLGTAGSSGLKTINEIPINENVEGNESYTRLYSDTVNLNVPLTRGSAKIQVSATLDTDFNPPHE